MSGRPVQWYFISKTIPSRNTCYCITPPATGTFQRVTLRLAKTKSRPLLVKFRKRPALLMLYLARARTRKVILSHEHIGFAWRKFDDAMQQLTYLNAKNLLSAAKKYLQQRSLAYR